MKHFLRIIVLALLFTACKDDKQPTTLEEGTKAKVQPEKRDTAEKSLSKIKQKLKTQGYQTFDYVDEKTGDTILMQQYFMVFLKRGPIRNQNEEEAARLQEAHLAHLNRMYEEGYADISGPFGDDGDMRGITIYNVPTLKMADSLANLDPMVKAGRLVVEVHPWWAGKGFPLR